jgi:hypothetical protein
MNQRNQQFDQHRTVVDEFNSQPLEDDHQSYMMSSGAGQDPRVNQYFGDYQMPVQDVDEESDINRPIPGNTIIERLNAQYLHPETFINNPGNIDFYDVPTSPKSDIISQRSGNRSKSINIQGGYITQAPSIIKMSAVGNDYFTPTAGHESHIPEQMFKVADLVNGLSHRGQKRSTSLEGKSDMQRALSFGGKFASSVNPQVIQQVAEKQARLGKHLAGGHYLKYAAFSQLNDFTGRSEDSKSSNDNRQSIPRTFGLKELTGGPTFIDF